MSCIFCEIIKGNIPSDFLYEDDYVVAINDLNPVTETHVLVMPKIHFADVREMSDAKESGAIMTSVLRACKKIAEDRKHEAGFRIVNNCGEEGGQTVMHVHFHLLAGENLSMNIV